MNLLVLGASGGCGKEVVSQAVKRGYNVTAVVRETTSIEAPDDVQIIRGSVLSKEILQEVIDDKDAVISCLGLNRKNKLNPWSEITSPENLTSEVVEHLTTLMKPNKSLAVISAAGVVDSFASTNLLLKFLIRKSNLGPAYSDLEKMEKALKESSLNWYAIRPVTLTDFKVNQVKTADSYSLFSMISRPSVAKYLLDIIEGVESPNTRTPIIKN
jgi:putative NADH-flavin reductase